MQHIPIYAQITKYSSPVASSAYDMVHVPGLFADVYLYHLGTTHAIIKLIK